MRKILILLGLLISTLPISCNKNFSKDTVILYTNDVHGEINTDNTKLSYKNVAKLKKDLSVDNNVLLLDSGDHISGGFYTGAEKGLAMVELMNYCGYDAATLGNHEFDYNLEYLKELMGDADYSYISTNFYNMKDGVATTRFTELGSKIFTFDDISIGVIGVSTPDSITTSTPSYFKDKDGNFIYTFLENSLYEKVQEEIDSIKSKCNYIVCLSHLGDEDQNVKFTATKLASNTSGIDFIFDGHTHQYEPGKYVKDKNGNEVLITQTGAHFERIGKLTICKDKTIKNEFIDKPTDYNEDVKDLEKYIIDKYDEKFKQNVAISDIDFKWNEGREFGLGDLCAESSYYYYNLIDYKYGCDFTITNTGGVRSEVKPGIWTLKTCNEVHSFGNAMCIKEFDGATIKTMLEFSNYKAPEYFGGQLQICGIKFDVNTNITSDIEFDSNYNYVSGPSKEHERISNIQIFDKDANQYVPFDINKKYKVGGTSYVLNEFGNGFSMLKDGNLLQVDYEYCDYIMLAEYVSSFDKDGGELPKISNSTSPLINKYSNLGINYTDDGFSKRINLISK